LRKIQIINSTGEPRRLLADFRQEQFAYERELGMTLAARMAIKANGTRAAFDLASAMSPSDDEPEDIETDRRTAMRRRCASGRRRPSTEFYNLFVVPTVSFKLLRALVILGHARRKWDEAPQFLIPIAMVRMVKLTVGGFGAMRIRDHSTAPRSPWQSGQSSRSAGRFWPGLF
jgi:hypothetical protein